MSAGVLRAVAAAGDTTGSAAVERAGVALAKRLVDAGLIAEIASEAVLVRGPGLRARAFGSRQRAADLELAMLVRGEGR